MAKRKIPSAQPSLFKKAIPQMPEGYYSSGPNPNLRRFIEEHGKPYDPETDAYNVMPFDKPITTTKATAIYNMHAYWSKKPYDAIQEYIKHYTKPGDLVLDPFCGSGSTALAVLMEGRAAIAIDLSPAATFITKNYCTPVDVDELQRAFEEMQRRVKSETDWLYETRCDRCDGRAITAFTVYSNVFQCPRCLEKVPLFDCMEVKSLTKAGKEKTVRICPYCKARGIEEVISTRSKVFGTIPVMVSFFCDEGCKPARDERRYNDPDSKKQAYFLKYDLPKIKEIETRSVPHWTPNVPMIRGFETTIKRDLFAQGVNLVDDLFTKRNLWALATILESCQQDDRLRFIVHSALIASSRRAQHLEEGGGYIPGSYHLPQVAKERNVMGVVERIAKKTISARDEITHSLKSNNILISTQSATDLHQIPSDSVDYIFTDPPYSGNVQYGELNFVWEAWMSFNITWHGQEIIVNQTRNRTEDDWANQMILALSECYRVLKPGRWLSLCYHDASEGTWQLVQDLMAQVGWISENLETALYIDTGGRTYNQYTADKVTKRDLVINFRKPRPGELSGQLELFDEGDFATFQEAARAVMAEVLTTHPGSTADRLYDELVSRLVRKGQFERHNFDELLRSVAEEAPPGSGRWYLLETAGQVDETESKKETAATAHLEAYMQKVLAEQRDAMGVHYSDLFEQYLPIKDKPRRLLQDWLPEFFFKTPDGTWRPPANEEERQQKADLRSTGALRRIKRFANALVDGVPPADRDQPENAVTLADWIRQCRRAGLFELGRVLYEKGGLRFEGLSEELQLQVEEDYQICVGRSEKKIKKSRTKGQQLSL